MWALLAGEAMVFLLLAIFYVVLGFEKSKKGAARSFCRGLTLSYQEVISEYEASPSRSNNRGLSFQTAVLGLCLVLLLVEIGCYYKIFEVVRKQNKNMIGTLSSSTLRSRNSTNVMTFTGQLLTFMLESSAFVVITFLLNFEVGGLEPASFPCLLCGVAAATSIALLMSSPEVKRHLQSYL